MKLNDVKNRVQEIPHMGSAEAQVITNFILKNKFKNILELGFRHGVSTCYMAAALDELNEEGRITTIDFANAKDADPNIETLLKDLGLQKYVAVNYEQAGYIWKLMKILKENNSPQFDFCYLDGAHNWSTDGFAFYLVDKLLKPGGWIIFDDYDWTYATSPTLKDSDFVKNLSEEERITPQVKLVYELLVKTHTNYESFMVNDGWAYAKKKLNASKLERVLKAFKLD